MTANIGTPDWQRGVFSPGILIGSFTALATETLSLPPNTESLVILLDSTIVGPLPTVTGTTSGVTYPVLLETSLGGGSTSLVFICPITPALDGQVTISWSSAGNFAWYVVADAGVRAVGDLTLAGLIQEANAAPSIYGLNALGTDGTDARQLRTDTGGRLNTWAQTAASSIVATFTTNGTIITVGGAGIIVWDATLVNTTGTAVAARVVVTGGFVIAGVPSTTLDVVDHFRSSRGLFIPSGDTLSAAVAGISGWTFSMVYDQL